MENANLSVYFTALKLANEQKFLTVRFDQNGNIWTGWPVEWNGDNPRLFNNALVNFPTGIVPNPSATGGVVIVGFSTKLNPVDNDQANLQNDTDTVLIAYKPDASVYWKHRVALTATRSEQATTVALDSENNLYVAGAGGLYDNVTPMVGKLSLPR